MSERMSYDVVVLGAGAGGMTAAAVAAAEGLKVLLIEKTARIGGTTAWSGGMVWIPANRKMRQAGLADSAADARAYLESTVPERENASLRESFLSHGDEAIAYLEANTIVRLQPVKAYPDYYPEKPGATPGGRVLEPMPFNARRLGKHFARLRAPLPEFTLFGGMMVNRLDIPHLRRIGRSLQSTLHSLRLIGRHALQRLRAPRGTTLHLGNALAGSLYLSLLERDVAILFDTRVERLLVEGKAVQGVAFHDEKGRLRQVHARRGVVLATGGFSHNQALRDAEFPAGSGSVSATAEGGTGDGIALGLAAGGKLRPALAGAAYWVPGSIFTREDGSRGVFPHTVTDRAKPGVIAVNAAGKRFVNEALSYHEFVRAMLRDGNGAPGRPFHLICDKRFLWTYGLGRIKPFTRRIGRYVRSGELIEASTIAELARALELDPAALEDTIADYNIGARQGVDPAFGRGGTIYERHLGDASHKPNPCVAPIENAPFYALRIHPADLGTATGLAADADGRALNADGEPVPGLYICGNDMSSIMNGHYPGPGITLGPALVFGYLAGRHLAASGHDEDAIGQGMET